MAKANNIVIARYSPTARTLLVLCPFCHHNTHVVFKEDSVMKPKDYLGSFICYGGRRSPDNEWECCGKELWVSEIK
jgi:hypothetical protein